VTNKAEAHAPTIVLVEDEQAMADEIRSELESKGYLVRPASIAQAADAARVGDASMMVMDRIVFGEDSLVTLEALRKEGVKIPVLVISALSSVDEKVKGLKAGGDDYLTKPFEQAALLASVRSLLRTKDLHDTVKEQATKLKEQTEQLAGWNQQLEERVATQLAEIDRIGRLQRFLAPQVAQMIASSDAPEQLLSSHRRDVSVVFCDLRGFTAFTETSEPEEVMAVLHDYHENLGGLIFQYEGTLDRFAGDGIMIVFNDPIPCADHTERAVRLALDMRDQVESLTKQWRRKGHDLGFGVGIATGYATLGQIGFEQRREYTAIGSVINLASRLCDEARPGQVIISQRAFGAVEQSVEAAPVGELSLKGFAKPVAAYEILRWREQSSPAAKAAGARTRKQP